jgi:membrane-bound serine protease (ClpP class)
MIGKVAIAFLILILAVPLCVSASEKEIHVIRIQGVINPPSAEFIAVSLARAAEKQAEAVLILLDTPGGLDTSMRGIIKSIMESPVPVVVYVYPSGARAASAGAIILLASHVAAMAPGTNVGAAHPVTIGQEKADKTMMEKVLNDAEAYVKSVAAQRGRNVEWAAKAVKESASITAGEALDQKVIDIVAKDVEALLAAIDGKNVETKSGKVTLHTKEAKTVDVAMPFKFRFLSYLADPNVAYILMMIGMYGILFEIYSPGSIFPGVLGGISLILALYAFQTIPISYAGLSLIVLGIVFFILELKIVSHGMLGLAGIVAIVIGSIMLVDLPSGILSISWKSIATVAILSGIFFFGVLSYAVKAQLSKVMTGREGLIGESGLAKTDVFHSGTVVIHGEIWNALSDTPVRAGQRVTVTDVKGLTVRVKPDEGGF